MPDGFLHNYFLNNSGKLLHKWMHYFDIYERHLERFRNTAPIMLEIGVSGGGSLAMWKDYLGPEAKIVGIDIDPACKATPKYYRFKAAALVRSYNSTPDGKRHPRY